MQKSPSDQARHHIHGPVARRFAAALVAMVLGALPLTDSAPSSARPIARAESLSSAPRSADQRLPILGAGLTIVADGSAPWEDRPLLVPGLGTLPGKRGEADPGDDTGPANRVVRSWDTIFYRVAVSVREAPADDVAVEVTLTGPAVWEPARVTALSLSGCPGGATLLDSQLPPAKAGGLRSD